MKIVISAEGDGREEDLQTLHKWLMADSALSGSGRATVTALPPRQTGGRMGIGPDEIQVLLGVATFALELGHSLRSWLKARQGASRLVVHVDDPEQAAMLARLFAGAADVRTDEDSEGREGREDRVDRGPDPGAPRTVGSGEDGPDDPAGPRER